MKQYSMKRSMSKMDIYKNAQSVYAAERQRLPVLKNMLVKAELFLKWLQEKPTLSAEDNARVGELELEVKDLGAEISECQKNIDNARRAVDSCVTHSFHQAG